MNVDAYVEMITDIQDDISFRINDVYELKNELCSVLSSYINNIDMARELTEKEIKSWSEIVSGRLTEEEQDDCDDLYLTTKGLQEDLYELIDVIDRIDDLL